METKLSEELDNVHTVTTGSELPTARHLLELTYRRQRQETDRSDVILYILLEIASTPGNNRQKHVALTLTPVVLSPLVSPINLEVFPLFPRAE